MTGAVVWLLSGALAMTVSVVAWGAPPRPRQGLAFAWALIALVMVLNGVSALLAS